MTTTIVLTRKAADKLAKKIAAPKTKPSSTCKFAFSDLRTCAMPRWKRHPMYCLFHAHQAQQLLDANKLGEALSSCTGEFRTSTDLNRALGNLFKAVAQNRIPPRSASVLAYIGQLLQQNIPSVQDEIERVDGEEGLDQVVRESLDAHDGGTERADELDADAAQEEAEVAAAANVPADSLNADNWSRSHRRYHQDTGNYYPHIVGFRYRLNNTGGVYVPIEEKPSASAESSPSNSGSTSQ
jgi:hypothetical protein